MRRGHPVNLVSGTYKSKKESRIMKEIWEAALRKQAAEDAQKENNNGQES
jgi:hypothetical protein